ncbi:MAG: AAA family ATPase [Vicinamibacterales bacterium]
MKTPDPFGVSRGYEQYFGLVESPFSLAPNTRFLFESESHAAAIEQVTTALRRREALTVITGEVGTGKTLLCRTIVRDLEPRTFISVISNPLLTGDDLLRQLLHDFDLLPRGEARAAALTQHEMVTTLQRFLLSLVPLRAHAIILIDEAQHLQPEVLEQVRLLSNLETGTQQLLQMVLVGQLDLDGVLDRPELRQLRQRISRRHQLMPLQPYEVEQYVERRLWVAHGGLGLAKAGRASELVSGERFWRVRFTASALRAVAQLSSGLPRSINVICDRALECAFNGDKKVIDAPCVLTAARQLKLDVPASVWLQASRWQAVAAGLVLLAAGGWVALRPGAGVTGEPVTPPNALARQAPVPASGPAASATPIAAAMEPGDAAPLSETASFAVAVASFRSDARAGEVARSLKVLDLPAYVEQNREGWHAVYVGPFISREEARDAQSQIARVHLTDSQIVSTAAREPSPAPDARAVATSGQKGLP